MFLFMQPRLMCCCLRLFSNKGNNINNENNYIFNMYLLFYITIFYNNMYLLFYITIFYNNNYDNEILI